MKLLALIILTACVGLAQSVDRYSATTGDVSLSAAGTALTLQQPATNAGQVTIESATIYCSVACNITQAQQGAAATATAGTWSPIYPTPINRPVPVNYFTASNVGAGLQVGATFHLPAGSTVTFCYVDSCPGVTKSVSLGTTGTTSNYTWAISAITGTANIGVIVSVK